MTSSAHESSSWTSSTHKKLNRQRRYLNHLRIDQDIIQFRKRIKWILKIRKSHFRLFTHPSKTIKIHTILRAYSILKVFSTLRVNSILTITHFKIKNMIKIYKIEFHTFINTFVQFQLSIYSHSKSQLENTDTFSIILKFLRVSNIKHFQHFQHFWSF